MADWSAGQLRVGPVLGQHLSRLSPLPRLAYNKPCPAWEAETLLSAALTPLLSVIGPHGGKLHPAAAYLAFDQESAFHHYLRMQYADQTFKGLYHWNFFDAAVLLPYFAVMILLSLYGIHRYTMAYQYFKYR